MTILTLLYIDYKLIILVARTLISTIIAPNWIKTLKLSAEVYFSNFGLYTF